MPVLKCSAEKCAYNKDQLCSKSDIQIQGNHALTVDDTCCSSFVERTGDRNSMDCGCGHEVIDVKCSAGDCEYNQNNCCHAGNVDITGKSACSCDQTCCGTFKSK